MTDALRYRDPPESGGPGCGTTDTCDECGAVGPVWRGGGIRKLCNDDEAKRLAVEALIR